MNNEETLNEILKIANNTLYFNDNSDYGTALWQILEIINPELYEDKCVIPELLYIEKDE